MMTMAVAAVAACSPAAGEAGHFGGTGETTSRFQAAGSQLSIDLALRVERGNVTIVVIDPNLTVRFRSAALGEGAHYADVLRFQGAAGEWRIVFQLQDAEGTYEVHWGT